MHIYCCIFQLLTASLLQIADFWGSSCLTGETLEKCKIVGQTEIEVTSCDK